MGIVRKVLLGLENRAGCIFSLLLNASEWRLRFKFETGWEPSIFMFFQPLSDLSALFYICLGGILASIFLTRHALDAYLSVSLPSL
jgi:hypothetical protein